MTNLTVQKLAESKKLPVEALMALGIESRRGEGVIIPYMDESGQVVAHKRRTKLSAKDGSYWPRGCPLMAYGLWRLNGAQFVRRLILVEGESDCWVLWHNRFPALGIPGAGAAKTLTAEAICNIDRIDVVIEPDQGGELFREGIARRLLELGYNGMVFEVHMPTPAKDPADLHAEDPDEFRDRFQECLNAAGALIPPASVNGTTAHASQRGGDAHGLHEHHPAGVSARRGSPDPAASNSIGVRIFDAPESPDSLGICLYDVKPGRVEWLWPGRLPIGKLAILDGDPGLGKSSVTLDLAARVSTGRPMPGETTASGVPADVVLLSAEDGLADTIRPRLEAGGADLSRVFALDAIPTGPGRPGRPPVFPDDVGWLYDLIRTTGARLVIIDPLMAFLGENVNAMNDQNVRRALFPLARLAETAGAAILVVRHLNKNPHGGALYRGGGSIGIIGAARVGMLVAQDPDDSAGRLLAVTKSNLAAKAPTLRFRVAGDDGRPRIDWLGESPLAADELLKPEPAHEAPVLTDAADFLRAMLAAGPVRAVELLDEARRLGLADITLRRAKSQLGAVAFAMPTDTGKEWFWKLDQAA